MLAKFALKGLQRLALDEISRKLFDGYNRIKYDKPKVAEKIQEYQIEGPNRKYSIGELSSKEGLESKIGSYTNNLLEGVKQYLRELGKITTDLQKIGDYSQINYAQLNAKLASAYQLMSGLIGYKKKKQNYPYSIDTLSYLDDIADMNRGLEILLKRVSHFDFDSHNYIARRVASRLIEHISEKKGIPFNGLARIVSQTAKPFAELQKGAKTLFVEYGGLARKFKTHYADLSGNVYMAAA